MIDVTNFDITNITIPNFEELLILGKEYSINTYNYLYPFFLKYIILLKEYNIIAGISIFLGFNVIYFTYLQLSKNSFSSLNYFIFLILSPISILIYTILLIDIIFKRVLYKILNVKYPYIPYKISKRMKELDDIMKIREDYINRFEK